MLKVGFVTCVQLGLSCMEAIYECGGRLELAISLLDEQARSKSGRAYLETFCAEKNVPLLKVRHVNDAVVVDRIKGLDLDWLFIVGWSQIAGDHVLAAPRKGVLGMHPTLLPEGRGRAPIPWAIIKGLKRTGVTLFQLDAGVDTGPILAQEVLEIDASEVATSLYKRVMNAHRVLICRIWNDLVSDRLTPIPQDDATASVWPARRPEDGRITSEMSVEDVDRLVRGCTRPYPGAFITKDGETWNIWAGCPRSGELPATADGALAIQCSNGVYLATEIERLKP